jgi:hypothetical protein
MPPEDAPRAAAAVLRSTTPVDDVYSSTAALYGTATTTTFPEPSGGGGCHSGCHRRRVRRQRAPPTVAGVPWPFFSYPWSGHILTTPAQHPAQALSTMGVNTPVCSEWSADSGASYHTTPDASVMSSVRPPHPSYPSSFMLDDGSCLPVTSMGSAPGPFRLPNVLVAPHMIHNLLFIRQFTADNSCSVEFDPSGLTVKDYLSRRPLLWCDSSGPLYTLRLSASTTLPLPSSPAAALATTSSSTTWHRHIGQAATLWLSSVVVHISLALGLLMSIFSMHVSWVARFAFVFLLLRMQSMPLVLFTVICGLLLFLVCLATSTTWSWLMIFLTTLGLSLYLSSLTLSPPSFTSFSRCPLSSASPLRPSSVTMVVNSITTHLAPSFSLEVLSCACLVCTPPQNGKAERMIRTTNDVMRTLLIQASLPSRF